MRKHASKEAFYQRLQDLAEVKKPSITESRNLGTLIDYKRAGDGIAYGIIKEQHHYYIKKAGTKQDPNVADFAYIGGLANITEFQYKSLSEADKQRNMIFRTINEAVTTKVSKTGSKKKLNEDKAGEEIDAAAEKVGDLDAATAAAELPPDTGGEEEMAAGLGAEPAGEEPVAEPAPEGGEEAPAEELPAPEGGEEELPAPEGEEGMPAPEGGEEEIPATGDNIAPATDVDAEPEGTEIDKVLGKLTNTIRKTELEPTETKSYLNTFISAFKDKLRDIEIEDRKEIANKILKVVAPQEIDDLSASVPQDAETGVEEEACAECGGFGKYAESRGYDSPQAFMECGEEEQGNVISGYANAHNDGMNDGDIKLVALLINPEMLEKLKGEYGHDEYAEKLAPEVNALSECKLEEREAQINELWGGLKNAFGKVGGDIKTGAQKVGGAVQRGAQAVGGAVQRGAQAVAGAAERGAQAVGQYATGVKQAYHAGEVPNEVKKLTDDAMALGKQVAALNARLQKAGKQPVNVQSLLTVIKNQLGGATGAVNLSQYAAEGVTDPANVQVQPTMLKEDDEPEEEEIEKTDVELGEPEETPEEFDTPEVDVDDTKDGAIGFAPAGQNLGGGVVKPEGAGVEIEITPDKTVNISMNESERKLRKYIRERLEVKAGLRKEKLTEGKKSETLKKLDKVIDEQFKLYESTVVKKK